MSGQKEYLQEEARTQLREKLTGQLRTYPQNNKEHGVAQLSEAGKEKLHAGCQNAANPTEHRQAFIDYVVNLLANNEKYSNKREALSFKDILDKKGLELYQKALEEESQDSQYRDAAFNKATYFVEGETWEKPASVIIAGPSACGKSHATDRVIDALKDLPKKKDEHGNPVNEGNLLFSIDGGVLREVSQMRKLAIRIANELGYSGIKDLNDQSKALEQVREVVKDVALTEEKFGVVLPETYSYWLTKRSGYKDFMEELSKNRTLVFSMVEGTHDDFRDVVKFMGHSRALKTDDSEVIIDLNSTENLKESKSYGETGFYFGLLGSRSAFNFHIEKTGNQALTIKIPNDLILMRQDPTNGRWEPAKSTDKDAIFISKGVYEAWMMDKKSNDLKAFAKNHKDNYEMMEPLELSPALAALLQQRNEKQSHIELSEQQNVDVEAKERDASEISINFKARLLDIYHSDSSQQDQIEVEEDNQQLSL